MSRKVTRRDALKRGIAGVTGIAATGSVSSVVGAADYTTQDIEVLNQNQDTVESTGGDTVAGVELSAAGPGTTSVQSNQIGITWGLNTWGDKDLTSGTYYAENIEVTFDTASDNPAESSVGQIVTYEQGSSTTNPDVINYAIDALWTLSNIPAPNPLSVEQAEDNTSVDPGLNSFTADIAGTVYDDATGGHDFVLHLGTDGSLESGTYEFSANFTADIYYTSTYTNPSKFGSLDTTTSFEIEVE